MAVLMVKDADVFVGPAELTAQISQAGIDYGAEALDKTTLGDTTRKRTGGLKTVGFSYSGYWTATASSSAIDPHIYNRIGVSNVPVTVPPTGSTEGALAYFFRSLHTQVSLSGSVGELFKLTATAEGDDNLVRGLVLRHSSAETASSTGTAFQLGGSSGRTVYACLHVLDSTGGGAETLTVALVSGNSSGAAGSTSITLAAATASTAVWGTAVGSTADWWRVQSIIAGTSPSFNYIVSVGVL